MCGEMSISFDSCVIAALSHALVFKSKLKTVFFGRKTVPHQNYGFLAVS